jgi:predicted  nucleic acid-binding Zn-ribbon protein
MIMAKLHKQWMLLAGGALALAGCQTIGPLNQGELDPRLANSHGAQFFSKSGFQACVGGALVGILGCQLSNSSDKGKCMIIAGLAGCGVGLGANYYLDDKRAKYANIEDRLDAYIADVRKDNVELQGLIEDSRGVIADDRRKIKQISQDIAAKKVKREQAQKQLADIDGNAAYLKNALDNARTKQQEYTKVAEAERNSGASKARLDALDGEINKLKQQQEALQSEWDQVYGQRDAIKLG